MNDIEENSVGEGGEVESAELNDSVESIKASKEAKEIEKLQKIEDEDTGRSLISYSSDLDVKAVRRVLLTKPRPNALNTRNNGGNTALIMCAGGTRETQSKEIAQMLVEMEGIDLNIQNKQGYSALHNASKR